MSKLAWVTGSKNHGYEIVVTLVDSTKDYHCLNHKQFEKYRPAQDIANLINEKSRVCKKKIKK
jgi:hypothetical protein